MIGCGSKRVKDRFIRTGMSRSSVNAENTSPARSAIMSGQPDARWHFAYNLPLI